jgi:hypothetical protein
MQVQVQVLARSRNYHCTARLGGSSTSLLPFPVPTNIITTCSVTSKAAACHAKRATPRTEAGRAGAWKFPSHHRPRPGLRYNFSYQQPLSHFELRVLVDRIQLLALGHISVSSGLHIPFAPPTLGQHKEEAPRCSRLPPSAFCLPPPWRCCTSTPDLTVMPPERSHLVDDCDYDPIQGAAARTEHWTPRPWSVADAGRLAVSSRKGPTSIRH